MWTSTVIVQKHLQDVFNVNKSDLIRAVHERMGKKITLKEIDGMMDAMLQIMSEKLKSGEEVQLADFGTFSLSSSVLKSVAKANNFSHAKKNAQFKKKSAA